MGANTAKADLEIQLKNAGQSLTIKEEQRQEATQEKREVEAETQVLKKDIEDLELAIQKLEQEKTNRDHVIRSLNDEISSQDEVINKVNKEKKHIGEHSAKASEDYQAAEDKVSHLNNIKSKLEQTLDELDDSLNREKRARAEVEKVEGR